MPIFTIDTSIALARLPEVTDLVEVDIADRPHFFFEVMAPEDVIDYMWMPLHKTGAIHKVEKRTDFIIRIYVSPMADAVKFRQAVMVYIFEYYQMHGMMKQKMD